MKFQIQSLYETNLKIPRPSCSYSPKLVLQKSKGGVGLTFDLLIIKINK